MKKQQTIFIFDKDNTLFHADRIVNGATREWTDDDILNDRPNEWLFEIFNFVFDSCDKLYISTASNEKYRNATSSLLIKTIPLFNNDNNIANIEKELCKMTKEEKEKVFWKNFKKAFSLLLFMRSEEDKKLSNAEVKRKNFHKIKAMHPEAKFVVFDDCEDCIKMYKEEGCDTCLVNLI